MAVLGGDSGSYLTTLEQSVAFYEDVVGGIIKGVVFGVLVGFIATFRGFTAQPTTAGVSAAVEGEAVLSARLAGLLPSVPDRSALVPSPIAGTVTGGVRPGDAIAVAVNDVVESIVTATGEEGAARFSALVPPGAFLPNADNEVRVFLLGGSAAEPTLAEIETRLAR